MGDEVWIGLVEVTPHDGNNALGDARRGYTNVLVVASSLPDYEAQVVKALGESDFRVVEISEAEPLRERMSRVVVSDEIVELGGQALLSGLAWTTFYTYPTEDEPE
jgi:hypothetical protein